MLLATQFRTNPLPSNLRERLKSLREFAEDYLNSTITDDVTNYFNAAREQGDARSVSPPLRIFDVEFMRLIAIALMRGTIADLTTPTVIGVAQGSPQLSDTIRTAMNRSFSGYMVDVICKSFTVLDASDIKAAFGKEFTHFTDGDFADLNYLIHNQYVPFMVCVDDADADLEIADVLDRAYSEASAIDIVAREEITLHRGKVQQLCLKFRTSFDNSLCAVILPRSGHGSKAGFSLLNTVGLIDSDYRGEWIANVVMRDYDGLKQETLVIKKGQALAQILVLPHASAQALTRVTKDELDASERGEGGFGSSSR